MINRKNLSGESTFFAITAIAICAVLVAGLSGLLAPAAASPEVSINNIATYASPAGYFPDQFARESRHSQDFPIR